MTIPTEKRDTGCVLVASSDDKLRSLLATSIEATDTIRLVGQVTDGASVLSYVGVLDAVVIDIALGGLGVIAVMEHLLSRTPPPVIVVVSRADAPYLRDAMVAAGASDFLIIPSQIDVLAQRVQTLTVRPSRRDFDYRGGN